VITQVNRVSELQGSPEKMRLLGKYIKLFNKKLREYAFLKQSLNQTEEVVIDFQVTDLDNVIKLMSESTDSSQQKFFNTLTEFALVLL
jgi:hypothetical protein